MSLAVESYWQEEPVVCDLAESTGAPSNQLTESQVALVESNLDLARAAVNWAQKHRSGKVDQEEALGDAYLGLCDAARRYDPARQVTFASYASRRVRGAVIDGERAYNRLRGEQRRQPDVVSLLNRTRAKSLDATLSDRTDSTLHDVLADPGADTEKQGLDRAFSAQLYDKLSEHLTERQVQIFQLKSWGYSLFMIGSTLGVSERTVSQDFQRVIAVVLAHLSTSVFED